MRIVADQARCSGCRACEIWCVALHEGRFATATARIRVSKNEAAGIDSPRVCRQCDDAPCVAACPVGALTRDDSTGAIHLHRLDCIVCPACADACPFDVVFADPASGMPLVCDLCNGRCACVERCATGALRCAGRAPSFEKQPRAAGDAGA